MRWRTIRVKEIRLAASIYAYQKSNFLGAGFA